MSEPVDTCGKCRFAHRDQDWEDSDHKCRRHPPVILETVVDDRRKNGMQWTADMVRDASQWPIVQSWDWCGEFEPLVPQ